MRVMRVYCLVFIALVLTGCAATPSPWGHYEQDLFDYYKNPSKLEQILNESQEQVTELESKGITPAPGLYAEIGTLCFDMGNYDCALDYYKKEHQNWPESRPLMNKLIRALQRVKHS